MTISLSNLKSKQSNIKRKRIGRGNASGNGTYAGKGLKGQKSRSGVSGLKRLGMKQVLLRTPKKRGFTSNRDKNVLIKFEDINKNFKDGDEVSPEVLLKKELIATIKGGIKVLNTGKLELKDITFTNIKASKTAYEQIKLMNGKIKNVKEKIK